ncbi:MAG: DUF4339 domain-containing protein [Actinobacteria bacterium]|nr:DUF4339 domain-containing protein [Actinomycetota bacterium]
MNAGAMDSGWYFWKQGSPADQRSGPFTWQQLFSYAQSGAITPTDLVWHEQLVDWRPAGQVAGLFAVPASPPVAATLAPPPMTSSSAPTPSPQAYAAAPAYGASPQYVATQPGQKRSRLWWILGPVIAVIIIGGGLGAFFGFWYHGVNDAVDAALEGFIQEEGEIFLEPAGTAGPDSFAGELFAATGPTTTFVLPSSTTASTATPTTVAPTTTANTSQPGEQVALASFSGDSPALYGGSKSKLIADKEGQLRFLEQNPLKARAFCEALNSDPTFRWSGGNTVAPSQLRAYFAELTPMMLTRDTRVTNHGYRNGKPTPRQSVLQAGQLVLVDRYGVPRVRCECGNPLIPPKAVRKTPKYTGPRWPGFDPTTIIVIQQTTVIIDTFVVIDVNTGQTFGRPAGSDGSQDGSPPQTGATTTTVTGGETTSTSNEGTTTTEPIGASELNGTWTGTFVVTELNINDEVAQAAEQQGCSLAELQALKGQEIPLRMDITVDAGGKSGTAVFNLDVSSLNQGTDGGFSNEPQTIPFTIDGNKLTFQVDQSQTPSTMTGILSRNQSGMPSITGVMESGDSTFNMKANWNVTKMGQL